MSAINRKTRKTDLTEEDIQFIMANAEFTREKIIEWHEEFRRQCPSGRLNKKQFIQFYKKLMSGADHPEKDEFCAAVFAVFDTDGSGSVDFGEFLIGFSVRAKGTLKEKLSWVFDIYDCDKNNYITQTEMVKMLRLVLSIKGIHEDPVAKAKSIIQALDRNKDGVVSKTEFIAGCTKDQKLLELFSPY